MEREMFRSSEKVWDKLVVSINNKPKRTAPIQQEAVIALSMAVCFMFFINYETIKRSGLNDFIYNNHSQLADPSDSSFTSDAWTKISSRLQKEE